MPRTIPRFLATAIIAPAIPLFLGGRAVIVVELFGDMKSAIPMPERAILQAISILAASFSRMDRRKRDMPTMAIPAVHNILDPILSERLPEIGERMNRNRKGVIIIVPADWGGYPLAMVR